MSSTGPPTSDAGSKAFFCYQCNRPVTIEISPSTDPSCPFCHEGFLEECDSRNPNFYSPNVNPFVDSFFSSSQDALASLLPLIFSSSTTIDIQNPNSGIFGGRAGSPTDSNEFSPLDFLRNHLQDLHSGGARIQFVIENSPEGGGAFRLPINIGDYVLGNQGLEQLIQQLAENDPNRYGTPPAAKSAIDSLPTITIKEGSSNTEMNQCAVCKDEFDVGAEVKQIPCKHMYHDECIKPWLEMHNSCPVCRYELPTDDPDYERRRLGEGGQGGSSGSGDGSPGGGENRTVERRFSISLPWPFGRQGSGGQSST